MPAPTRPRRTALLTALLLAPAAAALAAGCAAPGGLRDHGAATPVTPPPVRKPLWPGLAASPPSAPPSAGASRSPVTPQPVPEVTVPGRDLTAVDVRTLLAKDPEVSSDERRALDSCPACELRSPEYRDLTGDGRPELIVAVGTVGPVVLHVYASAADRVVPVLRVPVLKGFSAETIGTELWVHEPTSVSARKSSHYRWDGLVMALLEQTFEGVAPVPAPGTTSAPEGGGTPGTATGRPVSPSVTTRPSAVPVPIVPTRTLAPTPAPAEVSPPAGAAPTARPTPAPPQPGQ